MVAEAAATLTGMQSNWAPERLGALGKWLSGGTPSMANAEFWGGEIPWVSPKDMKISRLRGAIDHVTEKALGNGTRLAPAHALLLVVRGMILAHTFPVARAEVPLAFNQDIKALVLRDDVDSDFLLWWLQAHESSLLAITTESTHGTKRMPTDALHALEIDLPRLPEQKAIAAALNDVDALVGALEQLIAKKRDLRQAGMQQLLSGKTRLPSFRGKWESKRLNEVFTIFAGKSKSAHITHGGAHWVVDMGSVSRTGQLIVSKSTNYDGDFLRSGDLVMPKDDIGGGNIIGRVGLIDANDRYVLGDHVYCLRANHGDPRYLAFAINSHPINAALRRKVIGSAQLGLGRKSVTEQEIPCPPLAEQTAIATVLSDMDAELSRLEQRRDKTVLLKCGMMQELFAGRARLL